MEKRYGWSGAALLLALTAGLTGCTRTLAPDFPANLDEAALIRAELDRGGGGGGVTAATAAKPTGFADLRGRFNLVGTPPRRQPLPVAGDDAAICAPGGRSVLDELVVVGPGGGLANVLVYLTTKTPKDDPAWEHPDFQAARFAELTGENGFDQKECVFLSHVFAMRSTQKLEVINSDPIGHNTNISPSRGAKKSNQSIPAKSRTMYEPGGESPTPFPVTCSIHPWMKAWMITRDSPYFAVSAADGAFEILKVPAGVELEFRVWQEKVGYLETVTVNGEDQKWSKGRFTIKLAPESTEQLEVKVNAQLFQ